MHFAQSEAPDHSGLSQLLEEERKISGFKLNWFLKDAKGAQVTKKLPARQEDWKTDFAPPTIKQPLLHDMIQLASQLRLQNATKEQILQEVIHQKLQTPGEAWEAGDMCSMGQIKADQRNQVFSKVLAMINTTKTLEEPSVEDIETGYDLYHAVVFCPSAILFKVHTMVDQLLSVETSRTIIQTFVNLLQSGAIMDEITLTLTRQFYKVLADTLDLQYGNILIATSTTAQMQAVLNNKWPFFTNYTDLVKKCLQESKCVTLHNVFRSLGKQIVSLFSQSYYRYQRRLSRAGPPPCPPDS